MLDLLGLGVSLLFPLLATALEAKREKDRGLIFETTIGDQLRVHEGTATEDQALLRLRHAMDCNKLLFQASHVGGGLRSHGERLPREVAHEKLHHVNPLCLTLAHFPANSARTS